ncbi:hypothetical protein PAJ34TS1_60030 [Paenibacillus azoreducens]|uniref:Uncharacterized protein n=1 Tax=Paenibacillus azoreducens TaxID=116718 RepID=A0A919YJH6_9BACL|nr:hypothetical protein J34TS1_64090 [Paenibacillus azoreducens]
MGGRTIHYSTAYRVANSTQRVGVKIAGPAQEQCLNLTLSNFKACKRVYVARVSITLQTHQEALYEPVECLNRPFKQKEEESFFSSLKGRVEAMIAVI